MRSTRTATLLAFTVASTMATLATAKKPPAAPHPLSDAVAVSGCSDCETWWPQLSSGAGDEVLVGWHGLHDDTHVTLDRFGADGARAGNVGTLSSSEFLEFLGSRRDGDGWVAGWRVGNQTMLRRFDAGGAAGQAAMLALDAPAGGQDRGITLAARDGRVLAAWNRIGSDDGVNPLLAAWFDAGGSRLSDPAIFGESFGRVGSDACVRPDGSAVVVHGLLGEPPLPAGHSPTGVVVRRIDADGAPLGAAVLLTPPSANPFGRTFDVACLGDGSFAVAWSSNTAPAKKGSDVVWLRFDAAGKARGKALRLATGLDGDQTQPRLLLRGNGSLLATWLSRDGAGDRIVGRLFNAQGKALGKDFVLHTAAAGSLDFPSTAAGEGSHFALGWWQNRRGLLRWFGD
jgi:hypothetical protein